jgi:hypothetical protein
VNDVRAKTACFVALAAALLGGCPAPPSAAAATVRAGQRWRFRLGGLPGVEQAYEVTQVTPAAVLFDARTLVNGEPLGPPLPQAFPRSAPAALEAGTPGAPLDVSGLRLETWVVLRDGDRTTWAVAAGAPTFPGVVRVERGDEVILELTQVE